MNLDALRKLVWEGEGQHLEFKRKLPDPVKLMREATAFANTDGGWLLLGVEDDGEILGVKDAHEAQEAFQKWAEELVSPHFDFRIKQIPISRKRSVIAVRIPQSKTRPHIVQPKNDSERALAYIRVEDKCMKASREMFFLMLQPENQDTHFEYGEKENLLMKYLDRHGSITLRQFARLARISPWKASKTLVLLVRANVLDIQPTEKADQFFLAY